MLAKLSAGDGWRALGWVVTRRVTRIGLGPVRGGRRKAEAAEPEPAPVPQVVDEPLLSLDAAGAARLYEHLRAFQDRLRQMAEADEERAQAALRDCCSYMMRAVRHRQARTFDWTARPMAWRQDPDDSSYACDLPPNRATLRLEKDGWYWRVVFERPDRFPLESRPIVDLARAVTWAEDELGRAAAEDADVPRARAEDEVEFALPSGIDLDPYRIDPAALEPERSTYRVVIEMRCVPDEFQTIPLSLGTSRRHHERYASPAKLARELRLDPTQLSVEQPLGESSGWYFARSTVTYYREAVAAGQAQGLWDQTAVLESHRAGKVTSGRYGTQEMETGYHAWMGGCDRPVEPWALPESRSEYLAQQAECLTLVHALDLRGFRSEYRLAWRSWSDEQVLEMMHEQRARPPHIPPGARRESEDWLKEHGSLQEARR